MASRIRKVTIWIAVLFLIGVGVLIFSGGKPWVIFVGVISLPILLVVQAYFILREPDDGKEFPEDQWYEK